MPKLAREARVKTPESGVLETHRNLNELRHSSASSSAEFRRSRSRMVE
jgi:hypothetical protein